MPTLTVHDLRIAYHQFTPASGPGSRAPVVCFPSTGLSGLQWRRLAKQLADAGHEVFAVDLISYGDSEDWHGPNQPGEREASPHAGRRPSTGDFHGRAKSHRGPFRTEYDIDVADALLDMCDRPAHLVAHSYGGRVGLGAALRQPARIRSLSLFEPTCFGVLRSTGDRQAIAELEDYDVDGRFLADDFGGSEAWVERFVDYWSGPGTFAQFDPTERERWLRSRRKMFEEVRETALDDIPHTTYVDVLGHLPWLLLSGATSTRAGRRCCEVLAEVMPHGRHIELPDVGHMAPVLAGREVAALIAAHIAALEAE
jgi:pimeloyl-ACP methyl ester carboxylesterase